MSARPLLARTITEAVAPLVWRNWCSTPAGFAEAVAVVEGVIEGRFPRWVRLEEVREILALHAKDIGAPAAP